MDILLCSLPFVSRALVSTTIVLQMNVRNAMCLTRAFELYQLGGTIGIPEACQRSPGTTTGSPTIYQLDGERSGADLVRLA